MSMLPNDVSPPPRRWQFSLRAVLLGVLGISIVLAVASQFPRQSAFTISMSLLLLWPLAVVELLRMPLDRFGVTPSPANLPNRPVLRCLLRPFQSLRPPAQTPTLAAGSLIALLSTLTLVGLWPLIREVGLNLSLFALQPIPNYTYTSSDAARSVTEVFGSAGYWIRNWQWELWAVGRWWLLFGVLTALWLIASAPIRFRLTHAQHGWARFLAFTPWFIVLEMTFLIGVWIESPLTVPEPSTGFVVGIFSWDLWHWDCWLDRGWLIRGAMPSFVAGIVFFRGVLQWWWSAAIVAAVLLVPIAILHSIACTVAFQNGWPPVL